jgi:hypothetical protein
MSNLFYLNSGRTYNFLFSESGSNCHKLFPVLCIRIRQQLFRIHNTGGFLSQRQQISASDCTAELCIVKKNFAKISLPFSNSGLNMIEFIGSRNNIWDWYLFATKITFPFIRKVRTAQKLFKIVLKVHFQGF